MTEREVPLGEEHRRLGGRMVPFAGYSMPLQYSSIRDEHLAVRERAGLFDVSHMGEVRVQGPRSLEFLQSLVTNDVSRLAPGRALYTVMCRDDGGVVDDLLVYRRDSDGYVLVINAARQAVDLEWMHRSLPATGVQLADIGPETALLALQGPRALEILQPLIPDVSLSAIRYYHHCAANLGGRFARVSRTGYTGEDGFELYISAEDAVAIWTTLLEAGRKHGLVPAGLGARDTLRLEAGFRLYGQDIDESTDPISAGLGWVVKFDKGDFRGSEALRQVGRPPARTMVGLKLGPREIPRHGHPIFSGREQVGEVTSGSFGFSVGSGIALGYVRSDRADPGTELRLRLKEEPERWAKATVVPVPFYQRAASR